MDIDPSGAALGSYDIVKKNFLKNKNGCKKGKGKGRTCYKCGSTGHIAAACPDRAARVAAGGPERLDRPDLPMKGAKGAGKKGCKKGEKGDKSKGKRV